MKRVLCVVASLNTGGAETFLMKVLRSIDRTEYMLDFIVSAPGVYDDEVRKLGGKIYTIPLRTKHPINAFWQMRSIVKKNNYLFFLKLCDTPMGVTDLLAAKLGGAKRISVRSCNASSNTSRNKEIVNSVLRPLFNVLSDCKIAPSDLAAAYTFGQKAFENGDVNKLKNGVDLDTFKYDKKGREEIRSELLVDDDTVLIGHIGRFNQQKNHKFLVEVFASYRKINTNSKLLLVGTGELLEQTHKQVDLLGLTNSVIFAGVRRDVPQLLSAMDIFLLPSFYEGMPNTVIEAQATSLGCIVADTITREANITKKVTYLPIDVGTDAWIKALAMIEKDRSDVSAEFELEGYSIKAVVNKFCEYIFG